MSWITIKTVLGWVINTSTMTIHLPEHCVERLAEILASIPATQKRLSLKKWHKVLGELRLMSLALPGARNMFSLMQQALSTSKRTQIALTKGVHQALKDFTWMHKDIVSHPTRIAEMIPLLASALGYHDMIGLTFFFLLRPGEYTHSPSDSIPFEFRDVQLFQGQQWLNLITAPDAEILTAKFSSLTFRDQKNGGQRRSGRTWPQW